MKSIDEQGFIRIEDLQTADASEEKPAKAEKQKKKKKKPIKNKYGIPADYTEKVDLWQFKLIGVVLKKRFKTILVMTAIFALFLSVVGYIGSLRESSATMMLNYEQSVEGLAPNGTRFNLSDFKSDEVIGLVIENAGLEGKVSKDELRDNISITAMSVKKPTSKASFYIPTSFRIKYTLSENVRGITADNMLDVICNTYFRYFYDKYTMNAQILSDDYAIFGGMEYAQINAYLEMRVAAITDFLNMRIREAGSFRSEETGETFYSVRMMLDNLKDYNLSNYDAFIWEKGIVHDKRVSSNTRRYLINKDNRERVYNLNEYYIRKDVIEYYNTIMSTSILIPTVNNQRHYYMARTRTGVDYLAESAKNFLARAKELEQEIETNRDKLAKYEPEIIPANHKKADEMVDEMVEEITRIEKLANEVNKEYKAEYVKSYLTFTKVNFGFFDRIPKRKVAVFSLLFMLLAFYIYYKECIYIAKRGRKK